MTTAEHTHTVRNIGRCRSCKKAHRIESSAGWIPSTRCECGAIVKLAVVHGSYDPHIECGAKCRNAVGPSCDCSCGGANHGINH